MHINPRAASVRAQAALCVLAVTIGLTVAPSLIGSAVAAPHGASECASAQAAVKQAQKRQSATKVKVVKAKKALKKAKKAKVRKAAKMKKVKRAKKAVVVASKRFTAAQRAVKVRQSQARSACANPAPNPQAEAAGKKLSLLGLGGGLPLDTLDAGQLVALLERLLPGVASQLNPAELASLVAGFNAGPEMDPEDALSLLAGVLDPSSITDLLGGAAGPEALTELITHIIGELSSLGGGFPIPAGFDPAGLWETFAGMFGALSPAQLGSLLALVTSGLGLGGNNLDLNQLTDLIDSLIPGVSSQFDPDQLLSMLSAVNGGGLSATTLANLLGGQFSAGQLQAVLAGTAGQELLGSVVAQVMAQLGTAGLGGLELPGSLGAGAITSLISTVTSLVTSILGGGGVLPVVCGLLPFLCPK